MSSAEYTWDVFLSHNSADKPRVARLAQALVTRGVRVWFDTTSIKGSSSIPLAIEEGLEGSRTLVLCLSPAFLSSEWTALERAARSHADPANRRNSLLLLEFEPCQLPQALAHFRRLDFKRYSAARVQEVIEALDLKLPPVEPLAAPADALLDEATALEQRGEYAASLDAARRALASALEADADLPASARQVARARTACSHGLLLMEVDDAEAWRLADLGADATVLDGYPDLLFSALVRKAEAAMVVGRIQIAQGAVLAAQELSDGASDERTVLQLRAQLAGIQRIPGEAAALYEQAAQSFLTVLSRDPDSMHKVRAKVGVATCLSNKAAALLSEGDVLGASVAFSRAADWFAEAGSPVDESAARRALARCHFHDQEWDAGLGELERALALAEGAEYTSGVIACLEMRARALATVGRPDEARVVLLRAVATSSGVDDAATAQFHQMLATLADDARAPDTAQEHLDAARVVAERGGDASHLVSIGRQSERLGKRDTNEPPATQEVLDALQRRVRATESPAAAAHLMQQLASGYRSRQSQADLGKARDWYKRAYNASMAIGSHALAASALIGSADIALLMNDDIAAEDALREASGLVEHLPAWEVKASIGYYLGRLQLRRGDARRGRETLLEARTLATDHHLDPLANEIERRLERVEAWLDLRKPAQHDLRALSAELTGLESWYPEAQRQLRRLWYYWRGEEVMRNVIGLSGAKALIVSSDAGEVTALGRDLSALFDLVTFVADRPFADGEKTIELVPYPADANMPYINVHSRD